MRYKFFDHTADVLFEAYGKNLNELFTNAGLATEEVMVQLDTLKVRDEKEVQLEEDSVDDLLYNFLEELVFLKDTELLLFNDFEMNITENNGAYRLHAVCRGEVLDHDQHKLGQDVKAVTLHEFKVERRDGEWVARVILDI